MIGLVTTALLVSTLSAAVPANADEPQPGAPVETPETDPTTDPVTSPEEAAIEALEDVQEILDPEPTAAPSTEPVDLTMALRELRLREDDLPPQYRAAARRAQERPDADWVAPQTDDRVPGVLIHYDAGTVTTLYLNQVVSVVNHVLSVYDNAGYRAPEPDNGIAGDDRLDIYLDDIGDQRYYGYCATDQTSFPQNGPFDTWAYCAIENDFAEFGGSQVNNLKVTAAHELFHAIQFAYDYLEDQWFMEATATWIEDELYDGINDNRQYLAVSPLRQPGQSLDQWNNDLRQYGEWIFFRYLSERYPGTQGGLPKVMLRLWNRVDSTRGASNDLYSIQAVKRELASRGTDLRRFYAAFGDANRRPRRTYEEGAAYPAAAAQYFRFRASSRDTGWRAPRLDHLATRTLVFKPAAGLRNRRLHVSVDLPNKALGTAAILTTYDRDNRATRRAVPISARGNATMVVGFGTARVARAELTLSNAGTRYQCWLSQPVNGSYYSCQGRPLDDGRLMRYRVWATG